ncbi:hypothetical protein C8T65DRAFT_128256 [Cerioporus squamosus]|nr:hypothetical protein C8T65DRAFT_128256 [Cerioporus squamosus]
MFHAAFSPSASWDKSLWRAPPIFLTPAHLRQARNRREARTLSRSHELSSIRPPRRLPSTSHPGSVAKGHMRPLPPALPPSLGSYWHNPPPSVHLAARDMVVPVQVPAAQWNPGRGANLTLYSVAVPVLVPSLSRSIRAATRRTHQDHGLARTVDRALASTFTASPSAPTLPLHFLFVRSLRSRVPISISRGPPDTDSHFSGGCRPNTGRTNAHGESPGIVRA